MPTDELVVSRKEQSKTITRSTVNMAFENAVAVQKEEGCVKGPKRLKVFGASYLYAIFVSLQGDAAEADQGTGISLYFSLLGG